ncbi:MAG: hypothetical protein A2252_05565 [Elusimicrobia bacterium RIFOXYA2_FULL_39_19]|nr:MAG: hypothetical protein A2252_05565 [Elusimicrobia bacterium RIFOXYA2_FULL_39_19]
MYSFNNFTLKEMTETGIALRGFGNNASSMEEAAGTVINYFYNNFKDPITGSNEIALVRFFKTHPYNELNQGLQLSARSIIKKEPEAQNMKCLTLLATAGENPDWLSRANSVSHKAIPLVSEKFVLEFPMISNLITQLGLEINQIVNPSPEIILDIQKIKYNVFCVPDAVTSPLIPAKDNFVIPYGVKSVIGFGGILPSGSFYVIIIFSKTKIDKELAGLFKTLSLDVKLSILPLEYNVFSNQ